MTRARLVLILAAFTALTGLAEAQQPPNVLSPEVHDDRRVTFRFHAPEARAVSVVAMENQPDAAMTKGADGVWSATVGPLSPAIYSYAFRVDGATVTDPRNPKVKIWLVSNSMVEVPGSPAAATEVQNVPHGTLHEHTYHSASLDESRGVVVYTPPGYDQTASRRYPVLYLLHGFGDNQEAWTDVGRAHVIADNLIAAGTAEPLVIVMPYGHGISPLRRGQMPPAEWARNDERFKTDLVKDVMPLVERTYKVETTPAKRAVAGLSMGGGQSLSLGLASDGRFAYVAGFSSGAPQGDLDTVFEHIAGNPAAFNERTKLLWVGCGDKDFLLERNRKFVDWLKTTGVKHTYEETEGAHTWPVWRDYLQRVLPLLFR
jgi:enterochelin esterase-like enzyme